MQVRHYLILIFVTLISMVAVALTPRSYESEPPIRDQPFNFATPTPIDTPLPPATPSPTPAAPGCALGSFEIPLGSVVTLRAGVNLRATPSISGPWMGNFMDHRNFVVINGPVCGENYFWWQIRGHGVTGWVAERSLAMDFITFIRPPENVAVGCINELALAPGDVVELIGGVNIRQEPGLGGLVLTVAPSDTPVKILNNERHCVDGYNWRFVELEVVGVTYQGWMAEGSAFTPELFYVEPSPDPNASCSRPMTVSLGDFRRVRYADGEPKSLRVAPSPDAELLYTLVTGVPFEVIGGPVCAAGMNYWQIRILSDQIQATGWFPEGSRPNFWSEPFYDSDEFRPLQ